MTYECSTRTRGRQAAIEPQNNLKRDRSHHSTYDGYVESGYNTIRKEYNWDNSYML